MRAKRDKKIWYGGHQWLDLGGGTQGSFMVGQGSDGGGGRSPPDIRGTLKLRLKNIVTGELD